jgi:hypothetical protein
MLGGWQVYEDTVHQQILSKPQQHSFPPLQRQSADRSQPQTNSFADFLRRQAVLASNFYYDTPPLPASLPLAVCSSAHGAQTNVADKPNSVFEVYNHTCRRSVCTMDQISIKTSSPK